MSQDTVSQKAKEILDGFDAASIDMGLVYCVVLEALGKRAVESGNIAIMQSICESVANVDKRMRTAINSVKGQSPEQSSPAKGTVVMISGERYAAIEEAVLYYLRSVIERPELAYLQLGTEALAKMVRVHAEITGKTPEEVRKEVSDGVAATKQEIGYSRIIVKRVMAPPPDWIAVGGKRKYRGWLIVRETEDSYLCFRPDCIDYPERGYEDYEATSASGAKEWIDNYGEEEG